MKFGKTIQKRQLEIPEYAASFVDYKALKKLIKTLSATPILPAQSHEGQSVDLQDPQALLQANRASFFFRLERELEKVNIFYLQKEAELKLRLTSLLEQKRSMQSRQPPASKLSSRYIALEEGFRQFSSDLTKLQQFIEINQTAFSKILKKWDKASKSETKVIFLSRAVEVQPCFNRDVISDLSDQATSNLLDFAAWAEGERMQYSMSNGDQDIAPRPIVQDENDYDSQVYQAIAAGNVAVIEGWTSRMSGLPDAKQRITRAFLNAVEEAPEITLQLLLQTGQVDLDEIDDINHRNILHRAAISGRRILLDIGLGGNVDVKAVDIYGRIPLHYACMHGSLEIVEKLLEAGPDTVNIKDHDNFTPLIHSIVHSHLSIVQTLLAHKATTDPLGESDHTPLNLACQHGSLPIVRELLNWKPRLLPDAEGLYPQHLVARSSKTPQLLLLLRDYGADLDEADKLYQWSPLFHAASEGNVDCLKMLLENGVNPNLLDEKGLSALYYATWEGHLDCMKLLASTIRSPPELTRESLIAPKIASLPPSITPVARSREADGIPPLILPSPIIPVRRYGHNFLESKTFIIINFGNLGYDAIQFYDDNKYPAARLTISSKSSDLIPRNLLLPIQDDFKVISFQIDNLDTFAIDFDVYPTFGARVIARAVASSKVFTGRASSGGEWHLELLDPRLRAIGRISFTFQVVKPYSGIPLEITPFPTYWKETDQKPHSASLITGSSLSGDYFRLYVQMTRDGVAVLVPKWKLSDGLLEVPVTRLTHAEVLKIARSRDVPDIKTAIANHPQLSKMSSVTSNTLPHLHNLFKDSFATLQEALVVLPPEVNIEVHVLYPSAKEEEEFSLGPTPNINTLVDGILTVVFEHARAMRESTDGGHGFLRSMVFSSSNQDVCTAINWKQPNYPVLLCNSLVDEVLSADNTRGLGRTTFSIREAVQVARSNNLMGLICSSNLLDLAPRLAESIKTAGLVLISDVSAVSTTTRSAARRQLGPPSEGVDGTLKENGVLKFHESVDM